MPTVNPVTIQTASPSRALPAGAVASGFFIVENNRVILTSSNGLALHDPEGRDYTKELAENDDPRQVAARLLRSFRAKIKGSTPDGFDRGPINYGPGPKY